MRILRRAFVVCENTREMSNKEQDINDKQRKDVLCPYIRLGTSQILGYHPLNYLDKICIKV